MISWLLLAALARAGGVDSVTTVGVRGVYSNAVQDADLDALFAERLSASLSDSTTLRFDGRFRVDAFRKPLLERALVRWAAVEIERPRWWVAVGRSPVSFGGPRLVDGVQALYRGGDWHVGAWGGLVPDPYTGRPRARFGGGPIVAYTASRVWWSAVGEVDFAEGGLDRAAVLTQTRLTPIDTLDVTGRVDLQWVDTGTPVTDASAGVTWADDHFRLGAGYDAYGALRTLRTNDPDVTRFDARADTAGVLDWPDGLDPTLSHLIWADAGARADGPVSPHVRLRGRQRLHADAERHLTWLGGEVGVGLVHERIQLSLDTNWRRRPDVTVWDHGVLLQVEPTNDRRLLIDGSWRLLRGAMPKPGWYGDLFVDWLMPKDWALSAGVSTGREPWDDTYTEAWTAGFLTLRKRLRTGDQDTTRRP